MREIDSPTELAAVVARGSVPETVDVGLLLSAPKFA
jgi:hypothetical protein